MMGVNEPEVEAKRFNCGPRGLRVVPTPNDRTTINNESVRLKSFSDETDLRNFSGLAQQNDSSNLSEPSTFSEHDPEELRGLEHTNDDLPPPERHPRKRRRPDEGHQRGMRKITEFVGAKSSPKRPLANVIDTSSNSNSLHASDVLIISQIKQQQPTSRVERACQTSDEFLQSSLNEKTLANNLNVDLQKKNEELQRQLSAVVMKRDSYKETITRLLIEQGKMERRRLHEETTAKTPRIGSFQMVRMGGQFKEQWVQGSAFTEIHERQKRIADERNDIAVAVQQLKKRKPSSANSKRGPQVAENNVSGQSCSTDADGFVRPELPVREMSLQEYNEQEEIYRLQKEHLKKEETDICVELETIERERQLHLRELRRSSHERDSRYKDFELLNDRYLMISLLGKGGFSEVWRAFDLEENRYVACKMHHVNREWKEEKKANYVKHAMREKDIHKAIDHCRIVKLFDLFTIDNHSFCTVLEYCPGNDLDFYLKQHKSVPEKEARSIVMQVTSALVYLAQMKPPVIHYDLKPANILLVSGTTSGAIKITDFGLSKQVVDSDDADGQIELTSQFAGTYWYLPPETFVISSSLPKISNKVDVWSVGVIFYQCIYGRRPFGHEQSQQKILEESIILKAHDVTFPPKPVVGDVTKDFITKCLQYKVQDRPDVHELSRHELFRPRYSKMPGSPMTASSRRAETAMNIKLDSLEDS